MSLEAMLADLLRENEAALLPLVRKAYELGYREALAARPPASPLAVAVVPASAAVAVSPAPAGPLFPQADPEEPAPPLGPASEEALGEELEDEEPDDDDGTRPVRGSLTVGGLVRKITKHFGLERFDVEVRVCDPTTHRHLMRDVRLSRYVVEG